ncbi:radical SAM protein [Akkermansiaceae bacterium]|nr:radical SAM protein [Akkermansiaceae bacterium]
MYFGGGTPSMLSPTHLRRLFEGLRTILDFSAVGEVTLEANPATFTSRTAHLYEDLGVTRVSLGVQSFLGKHLETLGREHSPMQAISSVHLLREASNLEVNIDLIFSVPGQSLLDWEDTLTQALALQPDHLSAKSNKGSNVQKNGSISQSRRSTSLDYILTPMIRLLEN